MILKITRFDSPLVQELVVSLLSLYEIVYKMRVVDIRGKFVGVVAVMSLLCHCCSCSFQ